MSDKFEVGDVVMLKSGGPLMTVSAVREKEVDCIFFAESIIIDDQGDERRCWTGPNSGSFAIGTLQEYSDDDGEDDGE